MSIIVTTQEELDAAIDGGEEGIVIDSPPTTWLVIRGEISVETRGRSCVAAWKSPYVVAWGHSRVVAWDSSCVDAREWSTVHAWGYSRVLASPHATVYIHSVGATVSGGTIIDVTSPDLSDPAGWAAYHEVATKDGAAIVYKAVSQELIAGQKHTLTTYTIGSTVEATDWNPAVRRGGGLHFSPTPSQALFYYQGDGKPRFLACEVDIADLVPLDEKCKAPRCKVLHEVDQFGDPVAGATDDEQENTL